MIKAHQEPIFPSPQEPGIDLKELLVHAIHSLIVKSNALSIDAIIKSPEIISICSDHDFVLRFILENKNLVVVDNVVRLNTKFEQNTLILRDLPTSAPPADVTSIFSNAKTLDGLPCPLPITVRSDMNDTWFVTFQTEAEARIALQAINGCVYENVKIKARLKTESALKYQSTGNSSYFYNASNSNNVYPYAQVPLNADMGLMPNVYYGGPLGNGYPPPTPIPPQFIQGGINPSVQMFPPPMMHPAQLPGLNFPGNFNFNPIPPFPMNMPPPYPPQQHQVGRHNYYQGRNLNQNQGGNRNSFKNGRFRNNNQSVYGNRDFKYNNYRTQVLTPPVNSASGVIDLYPTIDGDVISSSSDTTTNSPSTAYNQQDSFANLSFNNDDLQATRSDYFDPSSEGNITQAYTDNEGDEGQSFHQQAAVANEFENLSLQATPSPQLLKVNDPTLEEVIEDSKSADLNNSFDEQVESKVKRSISNSNKVTPGNNQSKDFRKRNEISKTKSNSGDASDHERPVATGNGRDQANNSYFNSNASNKAAYKPRGGFGGRRDSSDQGQKNNNPRDSQLKFNLDRSEFPTLVSI